jgi:phenylpropionate dioxygenase-like ring-hydroxylating dioxygenase large terminal subunit
MWMPIALSRDVPKGATRGVVLANRELALWRGEGGAVQVWEDRCPHRGMRLSFGFVRGDSLNCLYHGWQYGTHASCVRIPAHPGLEVPATIKANAFPAIEAGGMIWTADIAGLAAPILPDSTPLASLAVDAPVDAFAWSSWPRIENAQAVAYEMNETRFYIGWHAAGAGTTMIHCATIGLADRPAALKALRTLRGSTEGLVA